MPQPRFTASAPANAHKDPVTLRLERGARWIVSHWQQMGLILSALAVAGVLGFFVRYNLQKLKERAWEQLSYAQGQASHGQRAEALQTLSVLLASNRSGVLAVQAHLLKTDLLRMDGKTEDAIAAAREALRQANSPEYKALALSALAVALEQAQKWQEAEDAYQNFLKDFPEHFLSARMYESLGRVQMAQQKWSDAQGTLERLITLYPSTPWARNAQDLLTQAKNQAARKS